MVSRYTHRQITWVNLASPTPSEVRDLMSEFDIHPLVAEELLSPSAKPKVEQFHSSLYLILHFPYFDRTARTANHMEVDFIVGKQYIITAHYDGENPFHGFERTFEVDSLLDSVTPGDHAGHIFFTMTKALYREVEEMVSVFGERLDFVEEKVFAGRERDMVFEISKISRDLLTFSQALAVHRPVLESLEIAGRRVFGDAFGHHLKNLSSVQFRLCSLLDGHRGSLEELRETNNSMLSTKQNEIMKNLTIMAFITLPLTVITQIFGMNTAFLPLVGIPGDFWMVIGLMVAVALGFYVYFRAKGLF
jgi:magnesium transporter